MSVVICDDHRLFVDALASVLVKNDIAVAARTSTPAEAVVAVKEHGADACILDINFPEGPIGIAAARAVREASPTISILMLTSSIDPDLAARALEAGANAVVFKMQPIADIVRAVRRLRGGEAVLDRRLAAEPGGTTQPSRRRAGGQGSVTLTRREAQVLELLTAGQGTAAIARHLGVGVATTRGHIQSIFVKLGVHSRIEAVAYAHRHDLVPRSQHSDG